MGWDSHLAPAEQVLLTPVPVSEKREKQGIWPDRGIDMLSGSGHSARNGSSPQPLREAVEGGDSNQVACQFPAFPNTDLGNAQSADVFLLAPGYSGTYTD